MIHDRLAMSNGLMFLHAFNILKKKIDHVEQNIQNIHQHNLEIDTILNLSLFVPLIVNGIFSCELFIKSMLSTYTKSHNIYELFYALDGDIKEEIKLNTIIKLKKIYNSYSDKNFNDDLIYKSVKPPPLAV